jgi:hypothetical protein
MQIFDAQHKSKLRSKNRTDLAALLTAELIGPCGCRCESHGIYTAGYAPALAMCRELLAAGVDPNSTLAIYRQGVLALRVRSIRQGAKLAVEGAESGTPRFRLARPAGRGTAPCKRELDR